MYFIPVPPTAVGDAECRFKQNRTYQSCDKHELWLGLEQDPIVGKGGAQPTLHATDVASLQRRIDTDLGTPIGFTRVRGDEFSAYVGASYTSYSTELDKLIAQYGKPDGTSIQRRFYTLVDITDVLWIDTSIKADRFMLLAQAKASKCKICLTREQARILTPDVALEGSTAVNDEFILRRRANNHYELRYDPVIAKRRLNRKNVKKTLEGRYQCTPFQALCTIHYTMLACINSYIEDVGRLYSNCSGYSAAARKLFECVRALRRLRAIGKARRQYAKMLRHLYWQEKKFKREVSDEIYTWYRKELKIVGKPVLRYRYMTRPVKPTPVNHYVSASASTR
jgi:hypothetical protein